MTIETKAREWAEEKWQFFWPAETLPELKETMQRAYLAGMEEANSWVPLTEGLPDIKEVGEKVLVHRLVNESQAGIRISVYDTVFLKHCEKETTHWLPLPQPPKPAQ